MKKLTAILLSILMIASLFAFASCDEEEIQNESTTEAVTEAPVKAGDTLEKLNGKTPEEIYQIALDLLQNTTNCTVTSSQDIVMTYEGQTQTMKQEMIAAVDGKKVYAKITNDLVSTSNMEYWYVDDVYYLVNETTSCKATIPYDEFIEKYAPEGTTSTGTLIAFPDEWFTDIQFVCESENLYYIRIEASGTEFMKYMTDMNIGNGLDMSTSENIVYTVYFDGEGNLGDIKTEFAMTIEGISAEYIVTSKVTEIGTTVVTPPENTEGWQDFTGQL